MMSAPQHTNYFVIGFPLQDSESSDYDSRENSYRNSSDSDDFVVGDSEDDKLEQEMSGTESEKREVGY